MLDQNVNIEQLITNPLFKTFHSIGLIDEVALRNHFIKSEYKELRKSLSQLNSIFTLSEKYNLSFDAVHTILFRKRQNKSIKIPLFN
jgi:hypothetical protein